MAILTKNRGSILILSLWMVVILFLCGMGLAFRAGVDTTLTAYQWNEMRLVQIAKNAVVLAVAKWGQAPASYNGLNQGWSDDPKSFKNTAMMDGAWTASHEVEDGRESLLLYGMSDEESRINLNTAPLELLRRVFVRQTGLAGDIIQWRERIHLKSGAAKSPFRCVEDLLLLPGMTPQLFNEVKNQLTVCGPGQVNINTAAPAILEVLGMDRALIEKFMAYRRGPDGHVGTDDDGNFSHVESLISELSQRTPLTADELALLSGLIQRKTLTVRSENFRLQLSARLDHAKTRKSFTIIIAPKLKADPILFWNES